MTGRYWYRQSVGHYGASVSLLVPLLLMTLTLRADPVNDAMVALEKIQMGWLAQEQSRPGVKIQPFRSDGCSGGLSDAWTYMAQIIPEFRHELGGLPPWQQCCEEHDRAYWRGETEQGYQRRLEADEVLRACVIQSGLKHRESYSKQFVLSEEEIQQLFNIAADMMYEAVRAGGKPCSYLPWRWGHGWPQCSPYLEEDHE